MDPFTEKLLERTRARRENLQKKMAERPNAANRPVAKRPLADTNSVVSKPAAESVPQVSSKPSPSKRRCSEENIEPAAGEGHQNPVKTQQHVTFSDPPTDKKPPAGPSNVRSSSSSLERAAPRPTAAPSLPQQHRAAEPEKMVVATAEPDPPGGKRTEVLPESTKEEQVEEEPAPTVTGMRSRLQRLAEQRKRWDGDSSDAVPDCAPLCLTKRQVEVAPAPAPADTPSGTPMGRRGRLANLAATIGSWEDDLSHAHTPSQASVEKTNKSVAKAAPKDAAVTTGSTATASSKTPSTSTNQTVYSPVKSSRVVPPSPQKADVPASRPVLKTTVPSPQKSSIQGVAGSAAPPAPVTHSPLKSQGITRGPNLLSSPQKPELRAKPSGSVAQEKVVTGTPGVKSFAERFGERCQERNTQNPSAGGAAQTKTFTVTPSAVTPNTRMVQERLRAAQALNTATADLTQRQKMERESELAQIRARFQKGNNMWKSRDEAADKDVKEPLGKPAETKVGPSSEPREEASSEPTLSSESSDTPIKRFPPGQGLLISPPASTSSPMKVLSDVKEKTSAGSPEEEQKEVKVNQSIDSAVINGLFEGILEQSDEQKDHSDDEEEEEDALNISSMSLLTPLVETVAAVVKSPDRKMMTSTPATSFIVRSNTPEVVPQTNQFQMTSLDSVSSDSIDVFDQDHKLPYSVDAYRSTRVKEMERPGVKQVIVRKEDVSQRADEAKASGVLGVKQKMKVLTSEMNLQQTVIHQASQALNCCTDEEHGKGSQVEAEAQRLLLVATERREALKAELDSLKGAPAGQRKAPAASDPASISASKGSITLQELRLPLKADFVCSTANRPESTKYSFFIMIRAGAENTVATPLASTHRGLNGDTLSFPTRFTLPDVSSSFEIDIEVYGLVQKREESNDKKKKPSKSKAITPKRFLAITKSAQTPVVASPGGPNSVRTSNFVLVGSHKLTLSSVGKDKFPLEKVPFLCPLEGHVHLKLQCDVGSKVEEKGFLTMFEDVSGFGAWHRRWCVLTGYCISYWTYPDDEKRKKPLGRVNLANCTNSRVEPVNREFCARPNTLELITVRPQREDDKETLVSQCHNTMCVTKNWLSADTKEERNLWMKKLNQILMDLRMWKPDSCYRPQ